jgi:hypothetical protein
VRRLFGAAAPKRARRAAAPSGTDGLGDVPACPPGWRTGPPDFVGVGAQKAGTTWWFRLIEAHPVVQAIEGQRPELHFFDRWADGWPGPEDIERYHRYFPRPDGRLAGEKTPNYMACHWIPRMLREAAPGTRVIALLRDPIERYVSGRTHEDRALERRHGTQRDVANETRWVSDAFDKGLYARQLGWLHDAFPPEQVLVLQYERCVADPRGELARTYAFLGLEPWTPPEDELLRGRNVTRGEKVELPERRRQLLRHLYEPDVRELIRLVPDLDPELWPHFAGLAR